jgi:hypothetical protein
MIGLIFVHSEMTGYGNLNCLGDGVSWTIPAKVRFESNGLGPIIGYYESEQVVNVSMGMSLGTNLNGAFGKYYGAGLAGAFLVAKGQVGGNFSKDKMNQTLGVDTSLSMLASGGAVGIALLGTNVTVAPAAKQWRGHRL